MPTGTATNRSAISLPSDVSSEILASTVQESAIMRLSRHVALPGRGLTIPVITSDPEADWVAETNKKPVSNPGVSTKLMQAYKIAVIVPFSKEFTRDLRALYDELVRRLPAALGSKFDKTVIGAAAAPGENFDTFASATAQSILTGESNTTYAGLVAAQADIATHGGILNGFALSPQAQGILLGAVDSTGRPLFINNVSEGAVPMILGARTYINRGLYKAGTAASGSGSSAVAGAAAVVGIAGDWTKAMYGTVSGVEISFSDQATLTAGTAESPTTINLWQQNMVAVRAEIELGFRADTSVFNLLTGATPAA